MESHSFNWDGCSFLRPDPITFAFTPLIRDDFFFAQIIVSFRTDLPRWLKGAASVGRGDPLEHPAPVRDAGWLPPKQTPSRRKTAGTWAQRASVPSTTFKIPSEEFIPPSLGVF